MWVQTLFRKWRSWEMMIMVLLRSLSTPSSQRMVLMSRLLVGSSSSMMSGSANSAWASSTRSFQPGRHGAHRPEVLLDRDADAEQQFAGARLGGVAVELGELHLQIGHRMPSSSLISGLA
jgi:hypothetical protein